MIDNTLHQILIVKAWFTYITNLPDNITWCQTAQWQTFCQFVPDV